ncbi:hypothetical protein V7S43_011930 [Phytophthora oleae]|uniref:Crinkler effector protein N-terminal domain-containing protein n=1 Tax=Phytophthora oleae TaxID=2107226 RepID=A0ABD3F821_9STRA
MVKLVCGFVGMLGSLFDVDIDDIAPVTTLKNTIKVNNEDIKCPERDLQLFLAKTKDGPWLTAANAANVTVNETGAVPMILDEHGNRKDFVRMDQSVWINNPKHFGANFQPREGEIHVLVVVRDTNHVIAPGNGRTRFS